jgi:hypothetical protein
MKIIFLDHDGVVCLSTEFGGRFKKQKRWGKRKMSMTNSEVPIEYRFDNFNKKAVKVLNEIIEKTDTEIVVSSDWKRWADVEEMGEYYESQGIIKRPIAFTPNLGECTWYINEYKEGFPWSKSWDLEMTRVIEIKQYLHDHPEVTHWVSVDDLKMGKTATSYSITYEHEWGLDNFVETPKSSEGIKQTGIKDKILKFLNDDIQNEKVD